MDVKKIALLKLPKNNESLIELQFSQKNTTLRFW